MEDKFTEQEIEKAFEKNGSCHSCNWSPLLHEISGFTLTGNDNEMWSCCVNPEVENSETHRGIYIYPEHE